MAKIYKANGEVLDIEPKNGTDFQLKELQNIVGGFIELINLDDDETTMVINEEGKINGLPYNEKATEIYSSVNVEDWIAGDVLVCKSEEIL